MPAWRNNCIIQRNRHGPKFTQSQKHEEVEADDVDDLSNQQVLKQRDNKQITYFVFSPDAPSRVKIGRTSNIKNRLSSINTDSPFEMQLYATTTVAEATLHQRFAHLRIHNEWFEFDDEIEMWIQQHATMYPID